MVESEKPTFVCNACRRDLSEHRCPGVESADGSTDETTMVDEFEFYHGDHGPITNTKHLWYVLLEREIPDPSRPFGGGRVVKSWTFAYTKHYARNLARRARSEGWTVVDIGSGTKTHISHKFRRL